MLTSVMLQLERKAPILFHRLAIVFILPDGWNVPSTSSPPLKMSLLLRFMGQNNQAFDIWRIVDCGGNGEFRDLSESPSVDAEELPTTLPFPGLYMPSTKTMFRS
jgi:hypothetical protein